MEFFIGEQGKITFSTKFFRGKPIFFRGRPILSQCNFMGFVKGKKKSLVLKRGYGYQMHFAHSYNFALHCYLKNNCVD